MSTFARDLARGKKVESEVLSDVIKYHPDAELSKGKDHRYDIWIPSIERGIEVKADFMSRRTGNIVIEIAFDGKPSALSTTEAYLWVFYTGNLWFYITPEKIRETLEGKKTKKFIGKGDTKEKEAYLIKIEELLENSHYVVDMNE